MLTLWTIQTVGAWEVARQRGVLRADGRRVWRELRSSYHWMMEQMARRLGCAPGTYPIWAWTERPDLRSTGHLPRGQEGVRVEFRVPSDEALLSDFDAWHCVLNDWYLALDEAEDADWQGLYPNDDQRSRSLAYRADMEASWQRIFDLDLIRSSSEWGGPDGSHTQAAVARVPLRSVRRVDRFASR